MTYGGGWRGLIKLASVNAQLAYVYRVNLVLQVAAVLLQIYLLKIVWSAVYEGRDVVDGVSLGTLITYLTISNLQVWLLLCDITPFVYERVRDGSIAQTLARPVGLIPQLISIQVGLTAGNVPFLVLAIPVAVVVSVLTPPPSVLAGLTYVASLLMAYAVAVLSALLLSLLVFWTFETHGVQALYSFVTQFFAGALVPLWFFPDGLRALADLLPFQTQAYLPVSIYLGRLGGWDAIRSLGVQAFWIVALYLAASVLWRRAVNRIVIQGG